MKRMETGGIHRVKEILKNQDKGYLGILERRGAEREGENANAGALREFERGSLLSVTALFCLRGTASSIDSSLLLHHVLLLLVLHLLLFLPLIDLLFHAGSI